MTHDECRSTLGLHALGALRGTERQAIEAHVEHCPACAGELAELRDTAASLAGLARPVAPSPGHFARVLAALDAESEARHRATAPSPPVPDERRPAAGRPTARASRRALRIAFRVAAVAAVALLCVSQVRLLRDLDAAYREMRRMRAVGAFLASRGVAVVPLFGGPSSGAAHAKVAFDRGSGEFVLLASQLPPAPRGKRYQLWMIAEGVSRATAFEAGVSGRLASPPRRDELFLFGLSLEPAGDTDEPLGPMVLLSRPVRNPG